MVERAERRLFWAGRVQDIALVIIGAGLAAVPGGMATERLAAGAPIALIGIMGIIRGLRELRRTANQRRSSDLYYELANSSF